MRRDGEVVPTQDALLAGERDVVEVLVDRDLDGEVERVASAGHRALGAGRRLDAAAAFAGVLLLLHLHDAVANFDDVDHLRRLELPLHRGELAAATRARRVGRVELEDLLDHGQLRLRGIAEVLARLGRGLVGGRRRRLRVVGRGRLHTLG
jgi:hypothetical protein